MMVVVEKNLGKFQLGFVVTGVVVEYGVTLKLFSWLSNRSVTAHAL